MANGLFAGIMTPEQAEAARQQRMLEQARAVAQLTPDQQGSMIAYQSGQRTGGLISDFMGFEPPEVKKARDFQAAVNRVQTRLSPEELSDPVKVYAEMAKEASALGYVQEAMQFATEAQKANRQERELTIREEDITLRRAAAERKVSSEAITTKGIRVFRRGDGPLQVEEDGQDVPYDPKKHGRFETAQDRMSGSGLTRQVDKLTGRVIIRDKDQNIVRIEPAPWETAGPATTTPSTPNNSAGRGGVRTVDQLLRDLNQK
jgi:hypothetical protein